MINYFNQTVALFEKKIFGVCGQLGEFLGISSGPIRMFFIYATFITKGSPVIIYMGMAFLMNIKKYWRIGRTSVKDL